MQKLSKYLNSQNSKDDEEGAADEDDVADGLQRREEGLDDQLEPGSSVDHSKGSKGSNEPKDSEDAEDFRRLTEDHDHHGVHQGHDDQGTVHDVPAGLEVSVFAVKEASGDRLKMSQHSIQ